MIIEIASIALLTIALASILAWVILKSKQPPPVEEAPQARRPGVGRMNLRRPQVNLEAQPEPDAEEEKDPDAPAIDKRQLAKQAKKEERKALRESQKAAFEEKEKKQAARDQKWLQREQEREEKERQEEEWVKKLKEEKEKQEQEEYDQWKNFIEVEEVGEEEEGGTEDLSKFIDYVRIRKVVMLDEVGAHFGINSKEAASRLEELEKAGMLSGVIDDRGKFIYITEEELQAVKKYIERRGRVSRAELCAESNRLIRLEPKEEDKARIAEEEKALIASMDSEEVKKD